MGIKKRQVIDVVTWIVRIIVGGVFIFSGLVKAVDPWGTLYKIEAYLGAMGLDIWPNLQLVAAFGLCGLEFITGILILTGSLRRTIPVVGTVIMAFMLPLTLWIAIKNPVADCGCFGDALIISNWATFWKNVALTAGMVWLLIYNRRVHWLITPALQWIGILISCVFIVVIEMIGYVWQPLIDFRPYEVGESLIDSDYEAESPEFVFIYEKDGVEKEFKEDDVLPDESEGWTFVDRKEIQGEKHESHSTTGKNLRIWDKDGNEDVTEEAISESGKELIVMMPVLRAVSPATTWKLNSLYEWSLKNNVKMIAVVSGSQKEITDWEDLSMASYPIYTADDTQIKEVVRGNPGIVYLENGKVVWKSTLAAIDIDDFMLPGTSSDARTFASNNLSILRNLEAIYLTMLVVLVFLSFTPTFKKYYLKVATRGGKVRREESSSPDTPAQ